NRSSSRSPKSKWCREAPSTISATCQARSKFRLARLSKFRTTIARPTVPVPQDSSTQSLQAFRSAPPTVILDRAGLQLAALGAHAGDLLRQDVDGLADLLLRV